MNLLSPSSSRSLKLLSWTVLPALLAGMVLAQGPVVRFDASVLPLANNTTVTTWGGQTASSTPTFQTGQTPNGGPAVQFNGTDRMGDNVSVPASSAQDWIYVAVIKPVNLGAYHNLVDDEIGNRPMLWIDGANRYEMNYGGGSAPTAGTGPGGWDIVIADSRLNQIYVNGATVTGTGGGSVPYTAALGFDFFHRDGGASFQGQVAEVQIYNDRAAISGGITQLYNDLYAKWIAPATTTVSVTANTAVVTPQTIPFTLTVTGTGFESAVPGNNVVTFNNGVVGTVVAAVHSKLTVSVTSVPPAGQLTAVVTNANGSSGAPVQVATIALPPAPTLSAVNPPLGTLAGGTSVTITGTGFTGANSVTFGGNVATPFTVVNDTTITAITPAHASGPVSVLVTTLGGTNAANTAYTYDTTTTVTSLNRVNPAITNLATVNWLITFASANANVTASNFALSGAAAVTSNIGAPFTSDGGISWTIPVTTGSTDGTLTLSLVNSTGQTPGVTATLPLAGPPYIIDKTAPVVQFDNPSPLVTAGSTVYFGFTFTDANLGASDFLNINRYVIHTTGTAQAFINTLISSPGGGGAVTLRSFTGQGTVSISLTAGIVVDAAGNASLATVQSPAVTVVLPQVPTVAAVTPPTASTLGGTTVTITGTGFTSASGVTFGGNPATQFNVVNDTTMTALTPAHAAGPVSVVVTTPGGVNVPNTAFTYGLPTITHILPPSGRTDGSTPVTIVGSGFTGASGVTIGGVPATGVSIVSDSLISCFAEPHAAGTVDVVVGTGIGVGLFTYGAAPITAGATWAERSSSGSRAWNCIASSADGSRLAAVVYEGGIFTSTDAGATWVERSTAGSRNWVSIASSADGSKLAAADYTGSIWTSADGGATWAECTSAGARLWYRIASSADGSKLAAVVTGGHIWTSTDGGATWTDRAGAGAALWNGIASSADGLRLVAVAFNGSIWTSTNGGTTWTERTSPGTRMWSAVSSSANGRLLVAVGFNGEIWTSGDGGFVWTDRSNVGSIYIRSVTSSASGFTVALAAEQNYIWTSLTGGSTWFARTNAGSRSWSSVASSADGSRLAATELYGNVWTSDGRGLPPTVTSVSPSTGTTLGGTSVTITGSSFTGVTGVTFGGAAAASFTVNNPSTITATTPAHAPGAVSVLVATPLGTNAANTAFTYVIANTAPTITSNGGGATASINVPENTTAVTTVVATDTDLPAQTITYSKSGPNAALFSIDSSTGALAFITAPDFEVNPGPFSVTVTATDNGSPPMSDSQDLTIIVTDVPEAAGFTNIMSKFGTTPPGVTDGSTFNTFYDASINNADRVIFSAQLTGGAGSLSEDQGTWTQGASGPIALVLRAGTDIDGSQAVGRSFKFPRFADNGVGIVQTNVVNVGPKSVTQWIDDGISNVTLFASRTTAFASVPANSAFTGFGFTSQNQATGEGLFASSLVTGGAGANAVTTGNDSGVWKVSASGSVTAVAREGEALPASVGVGLTQAEIARVAVGVGNIGVYRGLLSGSGVTSNSSVAVLRRDFTQLTDPEPILRTDSQAAGCPAGCKYYDAIGETINTGGKTLVWATLTGTSVTGATNRALFSDRTGAMAKVIRYGDDLSAAFGGTVRLANLTGYWLLDDDTVVLRGALTGTGVTSANDLFVAKISTTGTVTKLIREGETAAAIGGSRLGVISAVDVSTSGRIAVLTTTVNGTGDTAGNLNNQGLLIGDVATPGTFSLALRKGSIIPGGVKQISSITVSQQTTQGNTGSPAGMSRVINNNGKVTAMIVFSDTDEGVFVGP